LGRTEVSASTLSRAAEEGSVLDFESFFQAEYPGLVRSLFLLTADRNEAEEIVQEALARAYERWDRVGAMESPGGYVYRIAINLNRRRRNLAARARKVFAPRPDPHPGQGAETRGELARAIASLPRGQREAFMLVEWVGLSAGEAGQILGIKAPSVRSRVHRARTALRARLLTEGESDG
jgi:RNA polymerase sigma factor (sigma-70 family)